MRVSEGNQGLGRERSPADSPALVVETEDRSPGVQPRLVAEARYSFRPIGLLRSCFSQKFGIPQQPGLVHEAMGEVELLPPFNRLDVLRGLEHFSHLWLVYVFHQGRRDTWKATVRPPRLGGKTRLGVFATRSPHRPNPIGLSVVGLRAILAEGKGVRLLISGLDVLDGTPVLDIKPYLPYADSIPEARAAYAQAAPSQTLEVLFSDGVEAFFQGLPIPEAERLRALVTKLIGLDPRPAYLDGDRSRFAMQVEAYQVNWSLAGRQARIIGIERR